MAITRFIKGRLRSVIALQVKPSTHEAIPTITSSAIGKQAGIALYGFYTMDYLLPGGDRLRMLANHNKNSVQLLLLTQNPEKLRHLPGERTSSLVANTINRVNRYRIRSESYVKPRTEAQINKYQLASTCIEQLELLLEEERTLTKDNWSGQEALRNNLLSILEKCRDNNRLVANNPVISEGELGRLLYDTCQFAQHYQFNRVHPVSRVDQLDFSDYKALEEDRKPCFVWDSELHIGQDEEALADTLRVICQQYGLNPGSALSQIPANRFKRLELFFHKLWSNSQDWADHLASSQKPIQQSETDDLIGGLSITKVKPYHHLEGLAQIGYQTLDDLITAITNTQFQHLNANSPQDAMHLLSTRPNGSWVKINEQQLILRLHNKMLTLNYFKDEGLYYPLPCGDDLSTLSQLSKHHLYLPERLSLQLKAFFSRLPSFFTYFYRQLAHFITHDLHKEFTRHVHANHDQIEPIERSPSERKSNFSYLTSLQEILKNEGLLANGQTLEEFVQTQISNSQYVIVRAKHQPSPPAYENPLHRALGVLRHIAAFFVDTSEKNPIIGTLALAAYAYGAGAIMAPQTLTSILLKLHLKGLIYGIKPTQVFGQWMSHGTNAEAISAAVTYWQAIVVGGDLDQFFICAVEVLKEDPAEVAIIVALAISLGYGLCKAVPALQEEMGRFPYINYAALGAKGGAAIYDPVMHPGDDWLLGSIKWLLKSGLTLGKLLVGPLVEGYYYGYSKGFLFGLRKSWVLLLSTSKQILAAFADLFLAIATIPFLEISALLIHVPFRGLTNLLSKAFAILGHWQAVGEALTAFATRTTSWNFLTGFRLSPLYGFHNPISEYVQNHFMNSLINLLMLFVLPPLELIKNLVILPTIDLLSLTVRVALTILNPISRLLAYTLGAILSTSAIVWDNSIGQLFQAAARRVTLSANWIDSLAGYCKQGILGQIQIARRQIYDWAFSQNDPLLHRVNTDEDYFLSKPMRLEQVPHDSTRCLLDALLSDKLAALSGKKQTECYEKYDKEDLVRPSLLKLQNTKFIQTEIPSAKQLTIQG